MQCTWKLIFSQVEDTLFKVNRRDFEEGSDLFRSMFTLPSGTQSSEGGYAENPLILEGLTAREMEMLLRVVYPP